jgi:glutathione S-transferase
MTKPIIYQLAYSPYCIPITQALSAVGQEFEIREVPNWDRGEILKLTNGSYYQVPVIQFEDRIVYESGTETLEVARFVDEEFGQNKLFPKKFEGLQQIIVPYIENDVEGTTFKILDSYYLMTLEDVRGRGMMIRHKERKFGRGCVEEWIRSRPQLLEKAVQLLRPFEIMLAHAPFLLGDVPVYSDFALFGILENLVYGDWVEMPNELVRIKEWREMLRRFRYTTVTERNISANTAGGQTES